MTLRVGIDFHGVMDTYPEFFKEFSRMLVDNGHEVHIITGSRKELSMKELEKTGIVWTHFFSITDYHEKIGTEIIDDSKGDPHMPAKFWNPTKSEYCAKHGIQMLLDDSPVYGKFFTEEIGTIYAQVLRIKKPKSNFNPRASISSWDVVRMDDNGNTSIVANYTSKEEAIKKANELKARGHKQTYSVEKIR